MQALRAIKAGACGYLLKNRLRKDLPEAIRSVHVGRFCIPEEISKKIVQHSVEDQLTQREVEVLRQVASGNGLCCKQRGPI